MDKDYNKFLHAKLYLIESLSRKYLFAGNKEMKEIVKADNEYLKAYFKYLEKQDSTTVMNNTFGSTYESPCENINPNGMVCEMPSAVIDVLL